MGTNFYATIKGNACATCGRSDDTELHIGKRSAGWPFALHVARTGEECVWLPQDIDGWRMLLARPDVLVADEYGRAMTGQEMLEVISGCSSGGHRRHHADVVPMPGKPYDHCYGEFF